MVLLGPPINASSGWGPVGEQGAASECEAHGRGAETPEAGEITLPHPKVGAMVAFGFCPLPEPLSW